MIKVYCLWFVDSVSSMMILETGKMCPFEGNMWVLDTLDDVNELQSNSNFINIFQPLDEILPGTTRI